MVVAAATLGIGGVIVATAPAQAASGQVVRSTSRPHTASCSGYLPSGAVVAMAAPPDGSGYWIADNAGLVEFCGAHQNFGSVGFPLAPADRRDGGNPGWRRLTGSLRLTAASSPLVMLSSTVRPVPFA